MIKKVTQASRIVTDERVLKELARQGIDKDFVEFCEDYSPAHPTAKFYRDLKSRKRFAVISAAPKFTSDGKRIDLKWYRQGAVCVAGDNTFKATVQNSEVKVIYILSMLII